MRAFFRQVGRSQIDRDPLGRHGKAGSMECCLYTLPAFGHSFIRQTDNRHAHLAWRHHHLHIDRHRLYTLKGDCPHARYHMPPHNTQLT
ncbi:hypothetical protein D9M69_567900 [compost metagenome]